MLFRSLAHQGIQRLAYGVLVEYPFIQRGIGGPCVVEPEIITQVLRKDWPMERADCLDVQCGCFLQETLNLCAVFPYDTDIVAAGEIVGIFDGTEGTSGNPLTVDEIPANCGYIRWQTIPASSPPRTSSATGGTTICWT